MIGYVENVSDCGAVCACCGAVVPAYSRHYQYECVERLRAERDRFVTENAACVEAVATWRERHDRAAAEVERLKKGPAGWEEDHQRRALESSGLADEFSVWGCDAIQHVAEALVASRAERKRLAAENVASAEAISTWRERHDRLAAEVARLEAKAGTLRAGLVAALRWVTHPKEIDPTLPCVTDDEFARATTAASAALGTDAGLRVEAQLEVGRQLAEAAKALRSRLRALSVRMDGRHVYAIQNAPTFYEQVHAIDAALAAWDRVAGPP